jgi:hypothetical protein
MKDGVNLKDIRRSVSQATRRLDSEIAKVVFIGVVPKNHGPHRNLALAYRP